MKFVNSFSAATLHAALVLGVPATPLHRRADFCGLWDTSVSGPYTISNNLWGQSAATSGSQCTGVDSLSGNDLAWHTSWTWAGGPTSVKSYANAVVNFTSVQLSALKSIPTTWEWSYTGNDMIADVAYDLFTGTAPTGPHSYEIMIWLTALGGAGPIGGSGSPVATPTINGISWNLFSGPNADTTVYSFVASSEQRSFSGDLVDFVNYVKTSQGVAPDQYLQYVGAGTEPFTGSDGVLTVSKYSASVS